MNGTTWTKPGQGETLKTLCQAAGFAVLDGYLTDSQIKPLTDQPAIDPEDYWKQTNLRLTGHPLTAYDIRRIEECKVAR
jgi:hypothetical protein